MVSSGIRLAFIHEGTEVSFVAKTNFLAEHP